jgi:hypothetical protein
MKGFATIVCNSFCSCMRRLQLGDNLEPTVVVDKSHWLQNSCKDFQGCFSSDSLLESSSMNSSNVFAYVEVICVQLICNSYTTRL